MAVNTTKAITSAVWNSVTYDRATGGPVRMTYRHGGDVAEDRTGTDEYPSIVDIVNRICEVRVTMRDVKFTVAIGTKSNLVVTLKTKSATVTLTFANMVLVDIIGTQERGVYGSCELVFRYESADGVTVPLS